MPNTKPTIDLNDNSNSVVPQFEVEPQPVGRPKFLTGLSYINVATNKQDFEFVLNPIDSNANVFPNVTIVMNTDLGDGTLVLPTINEINQVQPAPQVAEVTLNGVPTLNNNLSFVLKVINTGTNTLNIEPYKGNQIGNGSNFSLIGVGSFAILTPLNEQFWAIQTTSTPA